MITRTPMLLALIFLIASIAACGPNAASVRKEAQANADKYFEFVKAGNLEGAYRNTFSANYKGQLDLETYTRFQQALTAQAGDIENYSAADNPKIDLDRHTVGFVYSVKTTKMATTLDFDVRMVQEGSEWRIDALDPKFSKVAAPEPNTKLPQKQPAPAKP